MGTTRAQSRIIWAIRGSPTFCPALLIIQLKEAAVKGAPRSLIKTNDPVDSFRSLRNSRG